jgi:hypothetical protein
MAKSKRRRTPKTILKLPDLEQSKSAVLNSLTSASSKRSYDHAIREFIDWYCSEPRLAFNKTVVTRYRIALEQHPYAPSTINLRLGCPFPQARFWTTSCSSTSRRANRFDDYIGTNRQEIRRQDTARVRPISTIVGFAST